MRSQGHTRKRITEQSEIDSEGSWAISYGDMVTLLLTFFILFFNVNQKATQENRRLQTALLVQLGEKASDQPKDMGKEDPKLNTGKIPDSNSIDETTMKTWGGVAHEVGSRIILEFPKQSFYGFGETSITPAGVEILKKFTMKYIPYAASNVVSVKAFTDDVPVNKVKSAQFGRKYEDNLELSALRAVSAMRVLQKSGIPLNRMRISGNGEMESEIRKLASTSSRDKGNPMARKVVLVIEPATREKP